METRLPMPGLQEIFATCWFCIIVVFISLVNPPYEEAFSEPSQTSRMELCLCILWEAVPKIFEWVMITPLTLLKPLTLSALCEVVYSNPSQVFRMDVSARIVGLACRRVRLICNCIYL